MINRDHITRGDGFERIVRQYPPVRLVIGTVDGVLGQAGPGAGAYVLLGRDEPRRCYPGRSERQMLTARIRASIRERTPLLGGVAGVVTIQSAVPELPWDEHDAAVCESALISGLPQRLVNVRRTRQPLRTTGGETRAAFETVQYVSSLLRSRGYLGAEDDLFGDPWAA